MILLVLAVWYVATVGGESDPDPFLIGRDGWTMEECQASGAKHVAEALSEDGVLGATFKCVELPMSQGI